MNKIQPPPAGGGVAEHNSAHVTHCASGALRHHLFTWYPAATVLSSTMRMILAAAKRITTMTMSPSIISTTTKSTIFASGAWNG